jgi:hypothetical protein
MASPTPNAQAVALARLAVVTGDSGETGEALTVHFNPVSLQLQVSNELKDTGNQDRRQYIAKTTTKLTMDLQFDTTDTGQDVTGVTRRLQSFVAPPPPAGGRPASNQPAPPVVVFEWGTLKFKGIVESYKETIDFFSANGVPLRAGVNLTLSRQDKVFDEPPEGAPENAGSVDDPLALDTPATSAANAANGMRTPGAARAVAAANGQASLRFGTGAGLTISGSIDLKPPVAFASGGAGLSLGGGAGLGIDAGAGLGLSAGGGFGISGGAGIGIGVSASAGIGASVSAGVAGMARLSATEGAFSGLNLTAGTQTSVRLDPAKLIPKISSTSVSTDVGATFQVGGKARLEGAGGLRADVGATAKLTFDAS